MGHRTGWCRARAHNVRRSAHAIRTASKMDCTSENMSQPPRQTPEVFNEMVACFVSQNTYRTRCHARTATHCYNSVFRAPYCLKPVQNATQQLLAPRRVNSNASLTLPLCPVLQVLTVGGRAVAVADTKIVLHGFVQCLFFWLAACRLTRRG